MHIERPPKLTGEDLRSVPLGRIEAWANGPGKRDLMEQMKVKGATIERATNRWLTAVGRGEREPTFQLMRPEKAEQLRRRALKLQIPQGRKRPDSFYATVADLYSTLAAAGSRRPASEIAEVNNLPVSTVHRWIKEARARKLLGTGSRGKAG
jgi:hypothetical protein